MIETGLASILLGSKYAVCPIYITWTWKLFISQKFILLSWLKQCKYNCYKWKNHNKSFEQKWWVQYISEIWWTTTTSTFCLWQIQMGESWAKIRKKGQEIFAPRYEYTHTEDRMWRKNRAKTPSLLNILGTCMGVDLNRFVVNHLHCQTCGWQEHCLRNFGYKWGEGFDLLDPAGFIHQTYVWKCNIWEKTREQKHDKMK